MSVATTNRRESEVVALHLRAKVRSLQDTVDWIAARIPEARDKIEYISALSQLQIDLANAKEAVRRLEEAA